MTVFNSNVWSICRLVWLASAAFTIRQSGPSSLGPVWWVLRKAGSRGLMCTYICTILIYREYIYLSARFSYYTRSSIITHLVGVDYIVADDNRRKSALALTVNVTYLCCYHIPFSPENSIFFSKNAPFSAS